MVRNHFTKLAKNQIVKLAVSQRCSAKLSVPLELPSEVSGDRQPHPVPELHGQVHPLDNRLGDIPLSHDVLLHPYLLAILTLDHGVPDTEPVEPWGHRFTILVIKKNNPAVKLHYVLEHVLVVLGWWPVVLEPHEPGGVQDGSNDELILLARVATVLPIHHHLKVEKTLHYLVSSPAPGQVIQSCCEEDAHGMLVALVVPAPGILQLGDGGTTHSEPVDVEGVGVHGGLARVSGIVQAM